MACAAALALAGLGLALRPVALRLDPALAVADAFLPWAFATGRPLPPDPWGRPWVRRPAHLTFDREAVILARDPLAPASAPSCGRWVVYSVGPDGRDDGGVRGPDVLFDLAAARRLVLVDLSPGSGLWLAALALAAWAVGRVCGRWRPLGHAPLVLLVAGGGAALAVGWLEARLAWIGAMLDAPADLPLVVPGRVALTLSLAAVLGLVAGLGRATTRAQVAGEGAAGA